MFDLLPAGQAARDLSSDDEARRVSLHASQSETQGTVFNKLSSFV